MKNTVLIISICFLVFTYPSYSQTTNNFSMYFLGGERMFSNQGDFTDRSNLSYAAGLDLHLKRFSLGLEGNYLSTKYKDLMSNYNMGTFIPDILGSKKYESIQLLVGPGFDLISSKIFKINVSGMAGLDFAKDAGQTIRVTVPLIGSGSNTATYILAQREPLDSNIFKTVFSPSLTIKLQVSKNVAVILKSSYFIKGTSSYNYSSRDITGIDWVGHPSSLSGNLMERPLETVSVKKDNNNLFFGIGVKITLWSKDKENWSKEKEKKVKDQGCPSDMSVCIDKGDFTLSGGKPPGGVYTGEGVSNNVFSPAAAKTGAHLIRYNPFRNNNPCSFKITVNPKPKLTCPSDTTVSYDSGKFELKGCKPEGGKYSGEGVSDGKFNPAAVGGSTSTITYKYKGNDTCEDSCRFNIIITKYYYDLSKEVPVNYTEIPNGILNVQFLNSYASVENAEYSIYGIESRRFVSVNNQTNKVKLYSLNGINRLSIDLKEFRLSPEQTYILTVSDHISNYYLHFKVTSHNEK